MSARVATASDIPAVAETLASAFFGDPVWGWTFPDPARRHAQQVALWTLELEGSIGYGWVWTTANSEAVTLWIPPSCPDLVEPYAARVTPLVLEIAPDRAEVVFDVFERFDRARPRDEPNFYLSLLATHPAHRGHGYGMKLLRENLVRIDAVGAPPYLESTNPANVARYESVGFEVSGQFALPVDGPDVTTMWRPAA